jgi:hypothetical protein
MVVVVPELGSRLSSRVSISRDTKVAYWGSDDCYRFDDEMRKKNGRRDGA